MPPVNLLAVSVGNTRTRVGAFVEGQLAETATFENAKDVKIAVAIDEAFEPLRDRPDAVVLLSSVNPCLLYTSPSPRDQRGSRMPSSA